MLLPEEMHTGHNLFPPGVKGNVLRVRPTRDWEAEDAQ